MFTLSARTPPHCAAIGRASPRVACARTSAVAGHLLYQHRGRSHFPARFAAVVGSKEQLREALLARAGGAAPQSAGERRLAFLFSGQASQYARMGAELYRHQPVFREEVDRCAEIVGSRLGRPLMDVLLGDDADS